MRKISLALALIFISFIAGAQTPKFGLKAGLNIADISSDAGTKFNNKLGLNAGLLAHIHLSPQFALQPEVVYSAQGGKYSYQPNPLSSATEEHELGLDYINIPLNFQYMFDNGFRLQTGPQVGFLINVKDKYNGQETEFFNSDDFNNVDFSWTAGLGYLSQTGFGIDARYNFGLSNVNEGAGAKLKNNVIQVGLFYLLDNDHKTKSR
jgi:hypothetical protein